MVNEYGVPKQTASLVPFFALTGTVVGLIVWGVIAELGTAFGGGAQGLDHAPQA